MLSSILPQTMTKKRVRETQIRMNCLQKPMENILNLCTRSHRQKRAGTRSGYRKAPSQTALQAISQKTYPLYPLYPQKWTPNIECTSLRVVPTQISMNPPQKPMENIPALCTRSHRQKRAGTRKTAGTQSGYRKALNLVTP